ncbi:UDP-Glycosyltransferase/glycogen phosphorylase [Rhizophagus irregularis]|uniref:UDP-Glycosyltransferase/glycogen phosphorylase n=1 Tax=Rhizophagus irregularis TaxID=588596 RepID=A0A2N1MCF7_9GLOM|nr:UDP-Glycosyltransferase/glycogen phosphorylase [Rhizophagus irregularis]
MVKKPFIFLLLILILLNQIYVDATLDYALRNIDTECSPKNILVGSYVGGRSHLKPILDVAAILIERGHNVTLLTSGYYAPSLEYPTVKQITLGPEINYKEILDAEFHKEFDYNRMAYFFEKSVKDYKETYEKYKSVAKDYNIDLFICDMHINEACLDIANTLKKPVVGMSSFFQFANRGLHKSDPMFQCNISLENESFLERFKCIILNNFREQVNVKPIVMGQSPKVSLHLVDTFFGFELPQSLPPNVQEMGPVLSEEYPSLTPELSDFMNAHDRILYVAFGKRFHASTENNNKLLQSFVEAINKKIIDGVVWALVLTPEDSYSSTITLTDGSHIQTSPILNNKHPHIHIAKFAPQFAILNHTNTKLFFAHGGAGSSHESLYTGTPMLVLPFGVDQMGNADKLESAGVALTLNKFNLDVSDIIYKIDFLLKDKNIKKNSERLEFLAKINSKRKFRAADSIEYILHSSNLNEGVDEEFLNEWFPAESRMGLIKGNNYDVYGAWLGIVLGLIGGILWVIFISISFILKRIIPFFIQKLKNE